MKFYNVGEEIRDTRINSQQLNGCRHTLVVLTKSTGKEAKWLVENIFLFFIDTKISKLISDESFFFYLI